MDDPHLREALRNTELNQCAPAWWTKVFALKLSERVRSPQLSAAAEVGVQLVGQSQALMDVLGLADQMNNRCASGIALTQEFCRTLAVVHFDVLGARGTRRLASWDAAYRSG